MKESSGTIGIYFISHSPLLSVLSALDSYHHDIQTINYWLNKTTKGFGKAIESLRKKLLNVKVLHFRDLRLNTITLRKIARMMGPA